jgi:hypothetical protein
MSNNRRLLSGFFPVAILILSVLLFFFKIILSGNPLFGSDFVLQFYPWKRFLHDELWSGGTLPFWNPYLFSGTPFMANIQISMFYPLGFLFFVMPAEYAYGYTIVLHCILGSIFMYVFIRHLSVSKVGALLSSVTFTYNGFLMAHIFGGHLTFVQNYIWIPLIFLYVHKFLNTLYPRHVILAGVFLCVQILGGFPQIAFYTILGVLLYTLYSIPYRLQEEGGPYVGRAALGIVTILVIGFSLAALQLIPTYEFMQHSTRAGGTSYEFATLDSFPPKNLITLLLPDLYGVPTNRTYWMSDKIWGFWEYCGYVGICALVLTLVAIKRIWGDRVGRFFVLLMGFALFMALGKYNPLYRFIYYLPGFHHFRIPAQILFLYVFAAAVLVGMGLKHLMDGVAFTGLRRIVVLAGLVFLLILLVWIHVHEYSFFFILLKLVQPAGLAASQLNQLHTTVINALWKSSAIFLCIVVLLSLHRREISSHGTTAGLLILISAIDLGLFAFPLIQTTPPEHLRREPPVIRQLQCDHGLYRAVVTNGCLPENAGIRYHFHDIQGYDPFILRRYMQYVNRSQQIPPDNKVVNMHYIRSVDNTLINMLNLKYIIDCRSNSIIKRNVFVPRTHIVHQALVMNDSEILDYMIGDGFDPMKTVVFSSSSGAPETALSPDTKINQEMCQVVSYASDEITIDARLNAPGFLVMSEINYPGWRAYVNGKVTPVLTGNYLFRTVSLEPGSHHVRFVFNPFSFKAGTAISLVSVVGILIALIILGRKRRSSEQALHQ